MLMLAHGCVSEPYRLSALEVAAIVIGCIIGTVILCCLLGTIIDCFMHVYKYWCSCLHKAYRARCPAEMIALRNPNFNPNNNATGEPTVLVVRAVPPSYSTIIVSCESALSQTRSATETSARGEGESSPAAPTTRVLNNAHMILNSSRNGCTIVNPHALTSDCEETVAKSRDMSTQTGTASRLACTRSQSCEERPSCSRAERTRLLQSRDTMRVQCTSVSVEGGSACSSTQCSEKCASPEAHLPPSYSSIFRNDYVTYATETTYQTMGGFLAPPR